MFGNLRCRRMFPSCPPPKKRNMREIYVLLLLPIAFLVRADAQTYRIDTSSVSFEDVQRPCLSVVYDAPPKTTKLAWDKFFSKRYGVKIKGVGLLSDKDLLTGEDVRVAAISDKRMNLYARVTERSNGCQLSFFISFGYDFFIGPDNYAKEFGSMKEILNDFSVEFLNDYYADEASSITKKIKSLERDRKSKLKTISKNSRKAKKESAAVASGIEAKNNSLEMDIKEIDRKIKAHTEELDVIKQRQSGVTRS